MLTQDGTPVAVAVGLKERDAEGAALEGFEHLPPVWELRVGDFRVFYDVDEEIATVFVRAVRFKDHMTTQDIIDERDDD